MIQITPHMRILVCREAVDFRKGIDGLVHLCRDRLLQDPFSGLVFIFRNRRQSGVKILVYDGQGFWLCHKRLSQGRFRWWPGRGAEDRAAGEMEFYHLQVLLASGDPSLAHIPDYWRRIGNDASGVRQEPCVPSTLPMLCGYGNRDKLPRASDMSG